MYPQQDCLEKSTTIVAKCSCNRPHPSNQVKDNFRKRDVTKRYSTGTIVATAVCKMSDPLLHAGVMQSIIFSSFQIMHRVDLQSEFIPPRIKWLLPRSFKSIGAAVMQKVAGCFESYQISIRLQKGLRPATQACIEINCLLKVEGTDISYVGPRKVN